MGKEGICLLTHHLLSLHHSCTFASTHLDPLKESVCLLVCLSAYLFIYLLLIVCGGSFVCMYICAQHVFSAHRDKKRVVDSLGP